MDLPLRLVHNDKAIIFMYSLVFKCNSQVRKLMKIVSKLLSLGNLFYFYFCFCFFWWWSKQLIYIVKLRAESTDFKPERLWFILSLLSVLIWTKLLTHLFSHLWNRNLNVCSKDILSINIIVLIKITSEQCHYIVF